MKKIILIGATKNFYTRATTLIDTSRIQIQRISLKHCMILLNKSNVLELYHANKYIDLQDASIFTQLVGKNDYLASLIYDMASQMGVTYNDPIIAHKEKSQKTSQMIRLSPYIPYPTSAIFTPTSLAENKERLLQVFAFPLVLKANGARGTAVWKIHSWEELEEKTKTLEGCLLLQEYIPNSYDIRVLVSYGEILGAIKRQSNDGFYNNLSKGGTSETIELTEEEKHIALEATKRSELTVAGVDIVRTPKGPYIFEVNKSPMTKGFEETTGIDVVKHITEHWLEV